VANVLLRSFDGGKNVGANLKILSQEVPFVKVAMVDFRNQPSKAYFIKSVSVPTKQKGVRGNFETRPAARIAVAVSR
jgi:hypothetical protein